MNLLGYTIFDGKIKTDLEKRRPIQELQNLNSFLRTTGIFSSYTQWIAIYSKMILHLAQDEKAFNV